MNNKKLPKQFLKFKEKYPEITDAHHQLGKAVHTAGPLDEKTRALVKIAICGGAKMEGGFHAQVRKARELGVNWDEITHVALLGIPSIGFPNSVALLTWIDDVKAKEE
ncbi:MAG TPA: carboxymuconolactone decarboxylase family protein [Sunxiuqinia sp.]|nr:carboxymuconolactone decarboxylase family protein [Sunxiuqinia sp.]